MKIDVKLIIIIILGAILAFSSFKCGEYKTKFDSQLLKNQQLDSINNELGQVVYQQKVQIVQDQEGFKKYTDSMFKLNARQEKKIKDVLSYYQSLLSAKIENQTIPYLDTLSMKKWEDSVKSRCQEVIDYYESNTITVPREAQDSTQYYNMSFTVRQDSLKVNKVELIDTQHIRFVVFKGGLFKRDVDGKMHIIKNREVAVQTLHTNPYIKIKGQQSALFTQPKKRGIGKILLSLGLGIFLGTKL